MAWLELLCMLFCIYLHVLPILFCGAHVLQGLPPEGEEIWDVREPTGRPAPS